MSNWLSNAQDNTAEIKTKNDLIKSSYEILCNYADKINKAAGKSIIRVSIVDSSQGNDPRYISVTNRADQYKAVSEHYVFSEFKTRTAVYTVNFGMKNNGWLAQCFGAAAREQAMGSRKAYVKIRPGGSHFAVSGGSLKAIGDKNIELEGPLAEVLEDIISYLPEDVRAKISWEDQPQTASEAPGLEG